MQTAKRKLSHSSIHSPRRWSLWPHLLMALFGAGWAFSFDVGVRIYLAEALSMAGFFFGLLFGSIRPVLARYRMAQLVLAAYALWALAIVVSDLANGTALIFCVRALGTPLIGGASLLFVLSVLAREPLSFLTFLAASALFKGIFGEASYGDIFGDVQFSWASVEQDTNYFKVRFAPFLTPALALVACFLARKNLLHAAAVFCAAALVYMSVDARSEGAAFFLAAVGLLAFKFRLRPKLGQILAILPVFAAITYGAYVVYINHTLSSGTGGHNAMQVARMQNPYNPFELLLLGRAEWLVATDVFQERPIFGYGSWALDVGNRYSYLKLERSGEESEALKEEDQWEYIPVHSLLISGAVWSGALGFAPLVWFMATTLRMLARLSSVNSPLTPAALLLTLDLIWSFFFSPPMLVRLCYPQALGVLIVLTAPLFQKRRSRTATMRPSGHIRHPIP